jgi:hypothetical protein
MRYSSLRYADDEMVRNMRHKRKCKSHNGHLATCEKCETILTANDIVSRAIRYHLQTDEYSFPDHERKLDFICYKLQTDRDWYKRSDNAIAQRYFLMNALVNIHNCFHANRCFKKGNECYANLPEIANKSSELLFKDRADDWFDFKGDNDPRYVFSFIPRRQMQDAFINTHSPVLTKVLGCNTNVKTAMNGPSVLYIANYQAKANQKEEKEIYAKVMETITKMIENCADDETSDVLPNEEGFRRLLAGVYTHCNAHICAAPMAHYLAIHNSRFRYSHDTANIPVIGCESFLMGKNTSVSVRNVEGTMKIYHRAMDYLYRGKAFKNMSMYDFYKKTDIILIKQAQKLDVETFELMEPHCLRFSHAIVYCNNERVPVFPWNWLGSTCQFENSLMHNCETIAWDYQIREDYCRRFLMLFEPFESFDDILQHNETYQDAFRRIAQSEEGFSETVMDVANNIQDICNSMRVELPKNLLSSNTCTEEDFENDNHEENDDENNNQLQQSLEDLSSVQTATIENDTMNVILSPSFVSTQGIYNQTSFTTEPSRLRPNQTVLKISNSANAQANSNANAQKGRHVSKVSELNTLVYQGREQTLHDNQNTTLKASGSHQSIILWGQNDNLDTNQQIAFEILAATYVLTFYEDATGNEVLVELDDLRKIARRRENDNKSLIMFVTGPAGAGKCKSYCINQFQKASYSQRL